ncbi:MAG: 3-oxoacyl-[Oscillospiraceae bacterium]|nr:3-oxoacyl-[acyl-carrier-protein] reductase [Oscillospiraceae bacterium]
MLNGKVALITGGSRGIGAAIARELASQGADLALVYAGNKDTADALCAEMTETYGVKAAAYQCNVADFNATKETVNQIKKEFGTVHILVNNAGITKDGLLAMMKDSQFDDVISVNLKGAFNMIRHCTPLFIRNRGGRIISISSVTGIMGNAGQANYAASKAGLIGLTKSVARELASRGITCNAVAPGFIDTDMTKELHDSPLAASIPLGRMGKPEEVAQAVAFLANADYITGEVIKVDGGIAM